MPLYDWVSDGDSKRRVLNEEETASAKIKADEIAEEFAGWVMADHDRRERLAGIYNEKFNNRVIRQYDGSVLTLPGKVPDAVISCAATRRTRSGAASRSGLCWRTTLSAPARRSLPSPAPWSAAGWVSRKPMIVVPNHMVEQFATDVYRLYPGAKVLAAGKGLPRKSKRRRLFSRIATGDWDIVIVPHSSFGFVGISKERETAYIEQEIKELEEAIRIAEQEDDSGGWGKPQSVKDGERQRTPERADEEDQRPEARFAADLRATWRR